MPIRAIRPAATTLFAPDWPVCPFVNRKSNVRVCVCVCLCVICTLFMSMSVARTAHILIVIAECDRGTLTHFIRLISCWDSGEMCVCVCVRAAVRGAVSLRAARTSSPAADLYMRYHHLPASLPPNPPNPLRFISARIAHDFSSCGTSVYIYILYPPRRESHNICLFVWCDSYVCGTLS